MNVMKDRDWHLQFKTALQNSNFNQASFARMIGVSAATISRYLSGEIEPKKNTLSAINNILNLEDSDQRSESWHLEGEPLTKSTHKERNDLVNGYISNANSIQSALCDSVIYTMMFQTDYYKLSIFANNIQNQYLAKTGEFTTFQIMDDGTIHFHAKGNVYMVCFIELIKDHEHVSRIVCPGKVVRFGELAREYKSKVKDTATGFSSLVTLYDPDGVYKEDESHPELRPYHDLITISDKLEALSSTIVRRIRES